MTTFVFDIDGTICTTTNDGYEDAKPFVDVRERINRLYELGHTIYMMSARGSVSKKEYTDFTAKQLKEWGFKYHKLIMNQKPHADWFIDDKAINISEWRTEGKVVGFVASSFDLIHPGYIIMLKEAKAVCSHLICALQSDPTLDRPEKNKPVQTLDERLMVLESIKYVDEVVTYNTEEELKGILKTVKPDIRILGTDYKDKDFTGKGLDIKIHWHSRNHTYSTSSLRKRIAEIENNKK